MVRFSVWCEGCVFGAWDYRREACVCGLIYPSKKCGIPLGHEEDGQMAVRRAALGDRAHRIWSVQASPGAAGLVAEPRSLPKRLRFAAFLYASYFRYVITAQARSDGQATRDGARQRVNAVCLWGRLRGAPKAGRHRSARRSPRRKSHGTGHRARAKRLPRRNTQHTVWTVDTP